MNRGYFCIWRKIEDSAVFQNEGLLKVFLWCLIRANHKESFVQVKTGRGLSEVKLISGSFLFGRESAAKSLHMSPSTVWKRILKLKKLEILNIESNSHYSIIYILNWHSYQESQEERNIESNRQVTGKEHRQECNNDNNKRKENIKRKEKPKTEASQFQLPEWVNKEAWEAFVEMRNTIKAPLTTTAAKLIISKLQKIRDSGQNPTEVLNQSITNCWRGVFAMKEDYATARARTNTYLQGSKPSNKYDAEIEQITREYYATQEAANNGEQNP